jgi:hypothetical protein
MSALRELLDELTEQLGPTNEGMITRLPSGHTVQPFISRNRPGQHGILHSRALLAAIGARGGWSAHRPVDTVSKARVALEALTTYPQTSVSGQSPE